MKRSKDFFILSLVYIFLWTRFFSVFCFAAGEHINSPQISTNQNTQTLDQSDIVDDLNLEQEILTEDIYQDYLDQDHQEANSDLTQNLDNQNIDTIYDQDISEDLYEENLESQEIQILDTPKQDIQIDQIQILDNPTTANLRITEVFYD